MKNFMKLISAVLAVIVTFSCVNVFASADSAGYVKTFDVGKENIGVVTSDDILWLWGDNSSYQLCDGTMVDCVTPKKIMGDVKTVSLGSNAVCAAIKNDNSLWMWGTTKYIPVCEDIHNQGIYHVDEPVKVMDGVKAIEMDRDLFGVLKTDGSLWMWGNNINYTIGDGNSSLDLYYQPVKVMEDVVSFDVSEYYVAAVKKDASLWVWGFHNWEVTEIEKRGIPYKIMDNVKQVSLGYSHHAAVKKDGSLWLWGDNEYGQIGVGDTEKRGVVTPVNVLNDVASVSLDYDTSTAIKTDGTLWSWGYNKLGDVGCNSEEKSIYYPVKILDNVVLAKVGGAVKNDGSLWLWGYCKAVEKSGMTALGLHLDNVDSKGGPHIPYPVEYKGIKAKLAYDENMCTVAFELGGGTGTTKTLCAKGELLTPPDNPYKDGYYFAGWYKDAECTKAWNFDADKVNSDCTLYAKWLPKSTVTVIADPSTQNIIIDGEEVVLNTYILRDAQGFDVNFVKLRDVAYLLNKTKANFNVDWRNNAIRLDKRKEYTTQNGAELTVPTVVSAPTKTSITPVLTDGVTAPLEAFLLIDDNGGGHNYFKLRDIGKVAGFNVEWDSESSRIVVTTTQE